MVSFLSTIVIVTLRLHFLGQYITRTNHDTVKAHIAKVRFRSLTLSQYSNGRAR